MQTLCHYAKLYVVHRGCPGDAQAMPGGIIWRFQFQLKNPFKKSNVLSQFLMSPFFSWDVIKALSNEIGSQSRIYLK
jgi:hypothetical protein